MYGSIETFGQVTDKLGHGYGPFYEFLADQLDTQYNRHPLNVLEIGIANGAGMAYFQNVFGRCVGVDIMPHLVEQVRALGFEAIVGRQDDPALPGAVEVAFAGVMPFDVIVDDASHHPVMTALTLAHMWQLVRPGGAYVIEDWNHLDGYSMWFETSPMWLYRMAYHHVGKGATSKPLLPGVKQVSILPEGLLILRKDVK